MAGHARDLLRGAEVRAERTVAALRMVVAATLGAAFVLAVLGTAPEGNAMLARQFMYAGGTLAGYMAFGLFTFRLSGTARFRPWMSWVFAAADVAFIAVNVHLSSSNTGLAPNYAAGFPVIWLAPLVLAFGALRYDPWLQGFQVSLLALGVAAVLALGEARGASSAPEALGYFFGLPPNLMRGAMLLLAGAVLVLAAARARALLRRALDEERRRANLTRYLPPQIAGWLAETPAAQARRGRRQRVAVLFCDVRGFTALAETLDPAELSAFVTGFRGCVARAAERTGGVIDKFIGDCAMVLFGVPEPGPDDAARALACARALLEEVAAWNAATGQPIRVGIGVHAGEVFCGAVGDDTRLEYTVLGDTVNVAARLEQVSKTTGVALTVSAEALAAAGEDPAAWTALPEEPLRGRNHPVKLYALASG